MPAGGLVNQVKLISVHMDLEYFYHTVMFVIQTI